MSWMLAMYFLLLLLLLPRCPASDEHVVQEPTFITAEDGESINITCHFSHPDIVGVYLRRKFVKDKEVLYASDHGKTITLDPEYKGRIQYFEQQNTVTIMMQQLLKNDTDNYICDGTVLIKQEPKEMQGRGTILAVTTKKVTKCSSSSWILFILIAVETLLLAIALGYFVFSHVDAKKYCQKQKRREVQNMVYEDMTYSLRHNAMTNQYDF